MNCPLVEVELELEGSAVAPAPAEGVSVEAVEGVTTAAVTLFLCIQRILAPVEFLTHLWKKENV